MPLTLKLKDMIRLLKQNRFDCIFCQRRTSE